jgi:phage regulator Rha-like protein
MQYSKRLKEKDLYPQDYVGVSRKDGAIDKSTHFLVSMDIQDGEFQYTDRYIEVFKELKSHDEAWKQLKEEEWGYLDFEDEDEEHEARDWNDRKFSISIEHIDTGHVAILKKYLH